MADSFFRFENPEYLYALGIIPLFIAIFILIRYLAKRKLSKAGDINLLKQLAPSGSRFKPYLKFSIMMLILALLVVGAANPQIGKKIEEVKREGSEVIIAIDVSNSMLSEDIKPSRLERSKQFALKLIDKMSNDKIGIIVFAGESSLLFPLTTDYNAAKMLIKTVSPELIQRQGTALGSAIELARASFTNVEGLQRALILISDGENHEDDALGRAKNAENEGIEIHAIAMGTIKGGPIPLYSASGAKRGYLKDHSGNIVMSKLDANLMESIAKTADGQFLVEPSNEQLDRLIDDLSGLNKKEIDKMKVTEYDDKFQWLLLPAAILMILELLISNKRNKYFNSAKLFGNK